MAFTTSSDESTISDINITPLVDVMLVLLVVFIVTAPLLNNAIPLNLPQTVATATLDDSKPVAISIDAAGSVFIDEKQMPLDGLEQALVALKSQDPEVALTLRADTLTGYGRVAQVLALVQKADIARLSVITQSQ
ncbi:hypothetical protein ALQ18_01766 [Pseudomonas marginalis pv. marginalis]|nr:hypothetical protein ALQ18_01766 [Pseudomonas marginalis pv. marginalis]